MISNTFFKMKDNYIHNIWLKRGYLDPKHTPAYPWQGVAYPGPRQAGYNHIPTRLIYEGDQDVQIHVLTISATYALCTNAANLHNYYIFVSVIHQLIKSI